MRLLWTCRCKYEDNIKPHLRGTECKDMSCWALFNMISFVVL